MGGGEVNKVWKSVKAHAEWVYFALLVGLGVFELSKGRVLSGTFDLVIGFAFLAAFYALNHATKRRSSGGTMPPPRTFEEGEVQAILSKGVEPVPIPGESLSHDYKTCRICKKRERKGKLGGW
jgi:hypothetical protein